MVGKIKNLAKNPIYNGLFIVTSGSILTTFLSYYLNFQTQSLFPDFAEFGDFVFIITMLTVSQIIPTSISGTLNLIVTELKVKNEYAKLTLLYIKMLVLFSLVGFVWSRLARGSNPRRVGVRRAGRGGGILQALKGCN